MINWDDIISKFGGGGGDDKPKTDPFEIELKKGIKMNMPYDNIPTIQVVKNAATKAGVSPSLLLSSAFQEGMNKALFRPDDVSEAFINAEKSGLDTKNFPVDGYYNYGLDTFGNRYNDLKKYLPEGFDQRFKTFDAINEKGEKMKTAAFKTNEDALIAKAAMFKQSQDYVNNYAKSKNISISPDDLNYFVLAMYNGGEKNADMMMDQYAKAKDKKAFIEKGETTRKGIHNNIMPRLQRLKLIDKLMNEKEQ